MKIIDYDIIYLSYDEPNAEKNYADLLTKIPWAKRVHGVEGSDAAHKACANLSETDRFITIDGDNIIDAAFLNEELHFKDDVDVEKCVISWSGYNIINGLTYGNGGIKCWPKDVVLNMQTHENADPTNPQAQVDFCWDLKYLQVNKTYSYVYNNATPQQAWRAGFREGVKMSLYEGERLTNSNFASRVHKKNFERLKIWQTIGADVTNGLWAIYGVREGCYLTNCTDWDFVNVRDFKYLNNMWEEKYSKITEEMLPHEIEKLGDILQRELSIEIPTKPYEAEHSKFFKSVYVPPIRVVQDFIKDKSFTPATEYDIVMITYDEKDAEKNYDALKRRFPRAKRIDGVKGIHQAHIAAAKLCNSEMIWIVDGDAQIVDDFNFDYVTPDSESEYVKVWRSRNPINNLEYGYGGVKLFPRLLTLNMDVSKPDMTTSISRHFKPIKVVSNITAFNTDEFSTWRSAFRECCKLASKVIDRQKSDETDARLAAWCNTSSRDCLFGDYAIQGARAGRKYGVENQGNIDALKKINDFDWLKEQFENQDITNDIVTEPVPLVTDIVKSTPKARKTRTPKKVNTNKDIVESAFETHSIPTSTKVNINEDKDIIDLLDRFEILYDGNISNVRRFYNDNDLSSVFKLSNNDELRKAVIEKNVNSIFRIIDGDEELRKAVTEQNLHSIFRLLPEKYEELRKAVTEQNLHSIFRLLPEVNEDLRKAVTEQNLHSIFRLLPEVNEDLRKAVTEQNLHSIFRIADSDDDLRKAVIEQNLRSIFRIADADDDLRKAVIEQNLRSIFRIADADDDLRKAVLDENLYSIARLLPDVADEFKVVNNNDKSALWRVLDKHTNSLFVKPLKSLYESDIKFDKDCFSRGQLLSKKWLTDTLKELNADLGVVFLCAGWYATIVPMLVENNIRFNLIRSFDIDPTVWTIAEIFNKPLLDGWKFKAQTKDIMDIDYTRTVYTTIKSNGQTEELKDVPDTIVNTSCEHISNFAEWYDKIPAGKLVILQSNDYFEVDEHVNCSTDLDAFSKSAVMETVLYEGELQLEKYTRFMKIGYK